MTILPQHQNLWSQLSTMTIGPQNAALDFTDRLARENGWSRSFALRVIVEYKRFVFLAATSTPDQSVTPSDAVDQAWHLHLAYTRDYWDIMCATILPQALHHGPTAGGDQERDRYGDQYQQTLDRYQGVFGPVSADIWPDSETRFAGAWQRIDRQRHLIISKTKASLLALIPASMLAVACSPQTFIAELNGMSDLEKGIGVGVGILLVSSFWVIGRAVNGKGGDGPGGTGGSGCGGGCGGCGG